MAHCSENRFCRELCPETRVHLCRVCIKTTHSANTKVGMDFFHHFLVLDGLCLTQHNRARFPYRPGDFVITPHPDQSRLVNLASVSFDEGNTFVTNIEFITDTTLAFFDKESIDTFLDDKEFLSVSYQNLQNIYAHIVAFFIGMHGASAYEAVCYLLKYCAHNEIGYLTHEQIAKITGLSRTTVTGIIHQITLAEPDLLQSSRVKKA